MLPAKCANHVKGTSLMKHKMHEPGTAPGLRNHRGQPPRRRFLTLVVAFLAAACPAAHLQVLSQDLGQAPLRSNQVTLTPLSYPGGATALVSMRTQATRTDTNGLAWFSNALPALYRLDLAGTPATSFRVLVPETNGVVVAHQHLVAPTNMVNGAALAYSVTAADARFLTAAQVTNIHLALGGSTLDSNAVFEMINQYAPTNGGLTWLQSSNLSEAVASACTWGLKTNGAFFASDGQGWFGWSDTDFMLGTCAGSVFYTTGSQAVFTEAPSIAGTATVATTEDALDLADAAVNAFSNTCRLSFTSTSLSAASNSVSDWLYAGNALITNGLTVPARQLAAAAHATNGIDFSLSPWNQFTNALDRNLTCTISNVAAGQRTWMVFYGHATTNYTVQFTWPGGGRIAWFSATNGGSDFTVLSNQAVMVSLFADRPTNIFAGYATNHINL